jgi:hypothetical protein
MKGTMLTISVNGTVKTTPLNGPPDLDTMQEAVGGYITQVPYLDSVEHAGTVYQCVAFVDEEGMLKNKPVNEFANRIWDAALKRSGNEDVRYRVGALARAIDPSVSEQTHPLKDSLLGPIVIIYGDNDLMSEL